MPREDRSGHRSHASSRGGWGAWLLAVNKRCVSAGRVGDPQFQPTLLVSTDQNGFIGQGRPTETPEPASLAVLLTGLGVLAWPRRRRSRH